MFFGGVDWGPLSIDHLGDQEMILIFVDRSNRGPIGGARWGSTPPSPCCSNPSSLDFWLGFFYNLDITKILAVFVSQGRGEKFLVSILCIAIIPVVIHVHYHRRCCRSSLSVP